MKKNRLLKVANMLEFIDPALFDMESWKSDTDCGTKYCAIGFAANLGLFKGLYLNEHGDVEYKIKESGNQYSGYAAVEVLFNIAYEDVRKIFGSHLEGTPKEIADNIRKFVKENNDA